jgi:hypothetical protein
MLGYRFPYAEVLNWVLIEPGIIQLLDLESILLWYKCGQPLEFSLFHLCCILVLLLLKVLVHDPQCCKSLAFRCPCVYLLLYKCQNLLYELASISLNGLS